MATNGPQAFRTTSSRWIDVAGVAMIVLSVGSALLPAADP